MKLFDILEYKSNLAMQRDNLCILSWLFKKSTYRTIH